MKIIFLALIISVSVIGSSISAGTVQHKNTIQLACDCGYNNSDDSNTSS